MVTATNISQGESRLLSSGSELATANSDTTYIISLELETTTFALPCIMEPMTVEHTLLGCPEEWILADGYQIGRAAIWGCTNAPPDGTVHHRIGTGHLTVRTKEEEATQEM